MIDVTENNWILDPDNFESPDYVKGLVLTAWFDMEKPRTFHELNQGQFWVDHFMEKRMPRLVEEIRQLELEPEDRTKMSHAVLLASHWRNRIDEGVN